MVIKDSSVYGKSRSGAVVDKILYMIHLEQWLHGEFFTAYCVHDGWKVLPFDYQLILEYKGIYATSICFLRK